MNYLTDSSVKKNYLNINANTLSSNNVAASVETGDDSQLVMHDSSIVAVSLDSSEGNTAALTMSAKGTLCNAELDNSEIVMTGLGSRCSGNYTNETEAYVYGNGSTCTGFYSGTIVTVSDSATTVHAHSSNSTVSGSQGSFTVANCHNSGVINNEGEASGMFCECDGASEVAECLSNYSLVVGRSCKIPTGNNGSVLIGQFATALGTSTGSETVLGEGSLQFAGGASAAGTVETGAISVAIGTSVTNNTDAEGGGNSDFWQTTGSLVSTLFELDNPKETKEDLMGKFVTLEKGKIRVCESDDDKPIGVVCENGHGHCSDVHDLRWKGISLKDQFGRKITRDTYVEPLRDLLNKYNIEISQSIKNIIKQDEDKSKYELISCLKNHFNKCDSLMIKKLKLNELYEEISNCKTIKSFVLNLDYDKTKHYVSRAKRNDWCPVAFNCKVFCLTDDSSIEVGDYVSIEQGKCVIGDKYPVIAKTHDKTVQILFK